MTRPDKEAPRMHPGSSGKGLVTMVNQLNAYGIVLNVREAAMFLIRSAREFSIVECSVADCPICEEFCDLWQSVYRDLTPEYRTVVDDTLATSVATAPSREWCAH